MLKKMWGDLLAGDWKFPEMPPRAILTRIQVDKFVLDDSELKRAQWFWNRRPALILGEDWLIYALVMLVGFGLFLIPLWGVALACCWITFALVGIFSDIVRLSRWRRDYEQSIARLLRSSQRA
jgi:hypothetical protein